MKTKACVTHTNLNNPELKCLALTASVGLGSISLASTCSVVHSGHISTTYQQLFILKICIPLFAGANAQGG